MLWSQKEVQLLDELLNWNFLREKIKLKIDVHVVLNIKWYKTDELNKDKLK